MRRLTIPCCLPILLLFFLAGCPEEQADKGRAEALPFSGQEIRIAVPAGQGFPAAWEGPLREWSAQTGATARLIEIPASEQNAVASLFSGEGAPTLALFPLGKAGSLLGDAKLAPIPEGLRGGNENGLNCGDLFAGMREKLAPKKGDLLLPVDCPVLVCYYRDDLLRAAGLSPPETWDDYQQLLEKLGDWAPGLTAVEPWSDDFRATMFLARALAFAQHPGHYSLFFDIETGKPLIDGAGFIRALETARAALARMPAEVLNFGPADCREQVLDGHAALAIAFESPLAIARERALTAPVHPAAAAGTGAIGFVRLPGSRQVFNSSRSAWEPVREKGINQVSLIGFSGQTLAASATASPVQIEAAWNALAKVAGRDIVSGFPPGVVGLCRESQLQDPASVAGPRLEAGEAAAWAQAVAESLRHPRVVLELPVSGRPKLRQALAESLRAALDGSQTAEEALHQAAQAWSKIVEKIGPDKVRDEYRVNLGLGPIRQ